MRSGLAVAERGWDAAPRGQADVLAFPARASDPAANRLLAIVARHRGIEPARLLSRSRCTAEVALSRQVAMYLCRKHLGLSFPELGRAFGGRDHSTALYSCKKVEQLQRDDKSLKTMLHALTEKCLAMNETSPA